MISFSFDKQRGKVNVEWMSRPVDSLKNKAMNQPLVLVLTSMEQSPTFASRLKRKLLSGPILRGAYNVTPSEINDVFNPSISLHIKVNRLRVLRNPKSNFSGFLDCPRVPKVFY